MDVGNWLIAYALRAKTRIDDFVRSCKSMDVKEAVHVAKDYVANLFRDEGVNGLTLEEVDQDDATGEWLITVGFNRDWRPGGLATLAGGTQNKRQYKVVRIGLNGRPKSVTRRYQDDAAFDR